MDHRSRWWWLRTPVVHTEHNGVSGREKERKDHLDVTQKHVAHTHANFWVSMGERECQLVLFQLYGGYIAV